jgi:anti-sigma factor RsiW
MTEFLEDYVAGELPVEVLETFEGHIARCGDCHVFLSQYRTTIRAEVVAFNEPAPPLPEALVNAIMAALQKTP